MSGAGNDGLIGDDGGLRGDSGGSSGGLRGFCGGGSGGLRCVCGGGSGGFRGDSSVYKL